ncbi:hypothetical protein QBC46DRAFT_255473 [Diplogelasinospora grovesii]|uniref:DUF1996 domain-containing protein n=1 Tax=Diplogelasinospora grovesii TaxID=303347 RepID=A0AAN6NBP6_9PEZI|nr:hypothetical protein QBC46DRAFT_255473 [Diplogelasinospora grovesii]
MTRLALLTAALGLAAQASATAFWVMGCSKPIVVERADPIQSPGQVSGHVHTIMGGDAFSNNMTYATTQTGKCTTCGVTKDLSNYWVPTVYFHAPNGSFISVEQVGGINVYYQERIDWTELRDGKTVQPFPKDFRMLAGDPMRRSHDPNSLEQRAIEFICLLTNGETGLAPFPGFPNRTCDGGLQIRVRFPSCWDGKNLDSPDHKSHVAYPSMVDNGVCPPTHPVRLLALLYEMTWNVEAFNGMRKDGAQPFVLSQGDPTGYGYHGDFLNGWDVDLLAQAIKDPSCGAETGGHIDQCQTFKPYFKPDDKQNECASIKSTVDEQVFGVLDKLPGCNPIQAGPQNATMQSCGGKKMARRYVA